MAEGGLFTVNQTIMLIYGVHVGSSVTTWFLSSGLKGTSKRLVMLEVLFNVFGVIIFVSLFYLEVYGQVPLVKKLVSTLTHNLKQQMAYVVLIFNWGVPLLLCFMLDPFYKLLMRICPPTKEEDLSKLQFMHDQALNDPESA